MAPRARLTSSRLCLLATSRLCVRPIEETVRLALEGGVDAVQLREKEMGDREFLRLARRVGLVVRDHGALFFVNDRVDAAAIGPADGVHLGQGDLPVPEARRILGKGAIIGLSTHTLEQAEEAARLGADYIGIGPLFPSTTKDTGYAPLGIEFAAEAVASSPLPSFAVGGVTADRVAALAAAGLNRVAVSSAICSADDPLEAARALKAALTVS